MYIQVYWKGSHTGNAAGLKIVNVSYDETLYAACCE
jgi:hypothetical protein